LQEHSSAIQQHDKTFTKPQLYCSIVQEKISITECYATWYGNFISFERWNEFMEMEIIFSKFQSVKLLNSNLLIDIHLQGDYGKSIVKAVLHSPFSLFDCAHKSLNSFLNSHFSVWSKSYDFPINLLSYHLIYFT
jgi:hypothetical protein